MSALTLYIGSKNLSSWSLRPWLFLRHHGVPFREELIPLDRPDTRERILAQSPSGKVPLLVAGELRVGDSLAICEYLAERYELPHAWPADLAARAMARSFAAEMHSGFAALRRNLPFNAAREPVPISLDRETRSDIERIGVIWRETRERHGRGGPWLFGEFGIVDAMFAPVAVRFESYAVPLGRAERAYVQTVMGHKAVREWIEAAELESVPATPAPAVPAPSSVAAKVAAPVGAREVPRLRSVIMPTD